MQVSKVSQKLETKINEIKSTIDYLRKDIDNIQNTVSYIITINYFSHIIQLLQSQIKEV